MSETVEAKNAGEGTDSGRHEAAALRRLATLVAEGASVAELFAAAADEIVQTLHVPLLSIDRFDPGRRSTVVASLHAPGFRVGSSWPIDGVCLSAAVLDTGRPAKIDDYSELPGTIAGAVRSSGVRSAAGAPIIADGAVWGMVWVGTTESEPLPEGTEKRLVPFTELVSIAVSSAEARDRRRRLVEQEASLRRVAVLVAEGAAPASVFVAVADEVARMLDVSAVTVSRFEDDGTAVVLASVNDPSFPVGSRWAPEPSSLNGMVLASGLPARIDDFTDAPGAIADAARAAGIDAGIAVPVIVDGALWGMVSVGRRDVRRDTMPGFTGTYTRRMVLSTESAAEVETRLAAFTELVATAISRSEAVEALRALAEEQAVLGRLATLVAVGAPSSRLYAAVIDAVVHVLGAPAAWMLRYEPDRRMRLLASVNDPYFPVGSTWSLDGASVTSLIYETGSPARLDDYTGLEGTIAATTRESGMRSSLGVPIVVDGTVWGAICVGTADPDPLPPGTEQRLERFTELVATAISNADAREHLRGLADEQAALRRVATLVARDAAPADVFEAVATEVGQLLDADLTVLGRYDDDGAATAVGSWSSKSPGIPVGTRSELGGRNVLTTVKETGRPARLDDYSGATGEAAEIAHRFGWRSSIAAPIVVEGRRWGVMLVATQRDAPFPERAEERLGAFTELVATAVANAQARDAVRAYADEQAALRRVATLVAGTPAPADVFGALTEEVGRLLGADITLLNRADPDGSVIIVGAWSAKNERMPLGVRSARGGENLSTLVVETGRPARIDSYDEATGEAAGVARSFGMRCAVGAPITVNGRLWGLIIAGNTRDTPAPAGAEEWLAEFTELIATAISNATARTELIASRARIVAAGDEARRRIERDLHDGTQQRLLALGLDLQRVRAVAPEEDVQTGLQAAERDVESILDEVRELSRGLHPAQLARGGLAPALRALARRSPVNVDLTIEVEERPAPPIETAAYYVISEAVTNAIRHSQATLVTITVLGDGMVRATVVDDGVGGARPGVGSGLVGLRDRVEALGGTFTLDSPAGQGTRMAVELPLEPPEGM